MDFNNLDLKNYFHDTWVMAERIIKHTLRSMDNVITIIAMPIMMMVASVYIFGGAMHLNSISYVDYIVSGILLFSISSGVAYAAIRLHGDVEKGIFERFHSMPIEKSSILSGHALTSLIFNVISCSCVLLMAFLMGFRPHASALNWLLAILVLFVFTIALTWIAVISGLVAKTSEGAGVFGYLLMGLVFASSGFAPTGTMPRLLEDFAAHQPMTPVINSVRSLLVDDQVTSAIWIALAWGFGFWILFQGIALHVYKKRTK